MFQQNNSSFEDLIQNLVNGHVNDEINDLEDECNERIEELREECNHEWEHIRRIYSNDRQALANAKTRLQQHFQNRLMRLGREMQRRKAEIENRNRRSNNRRVSNAGPNYVNFNDGSFVRSDANGDMVCFLNPQQTRDFISNVTWDRGSFGIW